MVDLTAAVKSETIRIRREIRLRLPDAIIAATATALEARLLTNDERLLSLPFLSASRVALK